MKFLAIADTKIAGVSHEDIYEFDSFEQAAEQYTTLVESARKFMDTLSSSISVIKATAKEITLADGKCFNAECVSDSFSAEVEIALKSEELE